MALGSHRPADPLSATGGASVKKTCCEICPECDGHMHACCNERGCRWEWNLAKEGEEPIMRTGPHGGHRPEAYWSCLICGTQTPMTDAQVKVIADYRSTLDERLIKARELPSMVPHE